MNSLIESFYKKEKDNLNISLEECNLICSAPFKFIKEMLNKGKLRNIRFQYFGVFRLSTSRLKHTLDSLERDYKKGTISEERYLERKKILEKYETKEYKN